MGPKRKSGRYKPGSRTRAKGYKGYSSDKILQCSLFFVRLRSLIFLYFLFLVRAVVVGVYNRSGVHSRIADRRRPYRYCTACAERGRVTCSAAALCKMRGLACHFLLPLCGRGAWMEKPYILTSGTAEQLAFPRAARAICKASADLLCVPLRL